MFKMQSKCKERRDQNLGIFCEKRMQNSILFFLAVTSAGKQLDNPAMGEGTFSCIVYQAFAESHLHNSKIWFFLKFCQICYHSCLEQDHKNLLSESSA